MTNAAQTKGKRIAVCMFSVLCFARAVVVMAFPEHDHEMLQGAFIRVGILLAAFWLVMGRPPAWKGLSSNWMLFGGIVSAILIRQAKVMFPVLAVVAGIAWFARPRKKSPPPSSQR